MKKHLSILLTILILVGTGFAIAGDLKPYAFPFIGKWQPSEDPVLIDDYGFQDIQNLRKDGKRLRGVSGHTKINTNVIDATYGDPANGFHFKKDQPAESHVLVQSYNDAGTASKVYQNTTAIPTAGNFSVTALHTDATNAGEGRFSLAPQGNVLYCNGEESMIWGGDETHVAKFITSTAAVTNSVTNPRDYTSEVRNTLNESGEVVVIGGGNDADCLLLLHSDGADAGVVFGDSSTGGAHGNANVNGTAQTDTDQKVYGSASGLYDGNSDWLDYADHADWDIQTNWTVELWVKHTDHAGDERYISQEVDNDNRWVFHHVHGGGLRFFMEEATVIEIDTGYSGEITDTNWHHIALCKVGNDYGIYKDGVQVDFVSDADTAVFAGPLVIGAKSLPAPDAYFDGHLDEIRITDVNSFGAAPVVGLTDTITVPTSPYAGSALYFLIGSLRPLQGVKFYIANGNTEAGPTLTCKEWNGVSWTALTITDNTVGLASTNTVTWTSTVNTSKTKFLEGELWHWYQFYLDKGDATIYHVTVDAAWQDVVNNWDGTEVFPVQFQVYDGGVWENYTLEVQTDGGVDYETAQVAAELDDLAAAEYIYIGFTERMTAIKWNMTSHMNVNAATVTIYYWNGVAWVSVGTVTDGTLVGGNTLAKSDYMYWTAPNKGEEFSQVLFGNITTSKTITQTPAKYRYTYHGREPDIITGKQLIPATTTTTTKSVHSQFSPLPIYYYKIMVSAALSADVLVDTIKGVPVVDDIKGYKFPGMFQGRSWLFSEKSQDKNKAIHSAFSAPDVWNGDDSGALYFGGDEELTASCSLYNLYQTSGIYQMLVTKENETYRVLGDGPENWQVQQLSGNVGCVAPLSMAVCEVADIGEGTQRHVAIWQASHGIVMCDGATIRTISDDIRCYWDPNDSRYIEPAYQSKSVGWYNPNLHVYKLLITEGVQYTTHTTELEYSLKHNEWTKIYREDANGAQPLQCGFPVKDTNGNVYTYGLADDAYMYRLENGKLWVSTAIAEYVWTKSFLLDDERPLFRHSTVNYFRLLFEKKTTAATEDIDIAHYCDNVATVHGTDDQAVPTDIDMVDGYFETQDCYLGPCLYHSFKLTANMSTVDDGMELLGMGLYYEAQDTINVD